MKHAFALFFGMGVPSAGPDAYPATPLWAIVVIYVVIVLMFGLLIWKVAREALHRTKSETHEEIQYEI